MATTIPPDKSDQLADDGSFVTFEADSLLGNSRILEAGSNVTLTETSSSLIISASASGGSGSGDMVLADIQTVTGAKTFVYDTLKLQELSGTDTVLLSASAQSISGKRLFVPDLEGTDKVIDISFCTDGFDGGALTSNTTLNKFSPQRYTVSGTFTITLPATPGPNGLLFRFKNIGTGTVTWDVAGGGTIDGSLTFTSSTQYQSVDFQVINGAWYVI